ncbi:MAG: hypothetical protein U0Y82_04320 [Thermoleophilia bacterium]
MLSFPRTSILAALAVAAIPGAGAAQAPAPANDTLSAASPLQVPARHTGTTVGATAERTDARPDCGPSPGASVWYRMDGLSPGTVGVSLTTAQGTGTTVQVYVRDGGDLSRVECQSTDRTGTAVLNFAAERGEQYVVEVVTGARAQAGAFVLQTVRPEPPPKLPGPPLPAAGAVGTVDVLRDTEDAYSVLMSSGVTYRFNLAQLGGGPDCGVNLILEPPGGRDPRELACGGFATYTPGPGEGGRYSLRVQAGRGVRGQKYRLSFAGMGADDQAPGVALPLGGAVRGAVSARGIDRQDVFHFHTTNHARVRLRLSTSANVRLRLLTPAGRVLDCACESDPGSRELERALFPGDYIVVVRARDGSAGRYRLVRTERAITSGGLSVAGSLRPGGTAVVTAHVSPAVSGGTVQVDAYQFDAANAWHFRRRVTATLSAGAASLAVPITGAGPWRFIGQYLGTAAASPVDLRTVRVEIRP